jgi:hypothetical protein
MAVVQDHGQVDAVREVLEELVKLVVDDRVLTDIVRAYDLVVRRFVAAALGLIRAVRGVGEDQDVTRFCAGQEVPEAGEDVRLRRLGVQ